MKKIAILYSLFFLNISLGKNSSSYLTDLVTDGSIIVKTAGINTVSLLLIKNKKTLTEAKLEQLNSNNIWFVDRSSAGNYNKETSAKSDIPLYASLAVPFLFTLNKNTREYARQLSVMYVEAVGLSLVTFTMTSALVEKSRSKVYNTNLSWDQRLESNKKHSFFSGHVATATAYTFFAAQVYPDFYPNSKAKPYIWLGAAILPAAVGFYRVKGRNHFLSDAIVGYIIGATSGILVPKLHKKTI
ncbi:phosphatase PAP2 family protein [Flavobacterium sp. J27]|uniref:phosphatase PAP2 family protein n=1 Tax=Flavobacterium sp. J27 TaxID=2060419 RepID=UPI00103093CD|nr:phosphatase PAP2 family protein [Flavobacterium sp. J27]